MPRDKQEGFCFKDNNDYNFPSEQVTCFTTPKYASIMISFSNQAKEEKKERKKEAALWQWITVNAKGSRRLEEAPCSGEKQAGLQNSAMRQKHI